MRSEWRKSPKTGISHLSANGGKRSVCGSKIGRGWPIRAEVKCSACAVVERQKRRARKRAGVVLPA